MPLLWKKGSISLFLDVYNYGTFRVLGMLMEQEVNSYGVGKHVNFGVLGLEMEFHLPHLFPAGWECLGTL